MGQGEDPSARDGGSAGGMSTTHTSGDWQFDVEESGCRAIVAGGAEIAFTTGLSDDDEDLANARLMVAAPDMLAALENMIGGTKHAFWTGNKTDILIARAALAKARGEGR